MTFLDFPHQQRFKGGGGGQAQQIESAPVPLPAPPVTQNNKAVLAAEHDYAMKQFQQKSVKKTIIAGDTGGYAAKPPVGPATATGPSGPRF